MEVSIFTKNIEIMEKIIRVSDPHRTNPESLVPGGSVVETVDSKGLRLLYDKIKNPSAYVARITKDPDIVQVLVDGEIFWEREQ
jgi:hypothetical protein